MHKTTRKHVHHNDYDLYSDLEKIKLAIADATSGARDRASELLSQSFDDARERSTAVKENVTDYVTERPFKSMGIALLAGVLIGYFVRK